MNATKEQKIAALHDAQILEQRIAALIDEFHQKHRPFQVNVLTQNRPIEDLYDINKMGAAQVIIHNTYRSDGVWPILPASVYYAKPFREVRYTNNE